MPAFRDITGMRVGMLVAMEPTNQRSSAGGIRWRWACACGQHAQRTLDEARKGAGHCGCRPRPRMSDEAKAKMRAAKLGKPNLGRRREVRESASGAATVMCSACGEWLPLDEFHRCSAQSTGVTSRCRLCDADLRVAADKPRKVRWLPRLMRDAGWRRCCACKAILTEDSFYKGSSGYSSKCKPCDVAAAALWVNENRERSNQAARRRRSFNHEAALAAEACWRERNRESERKRARRNGQRQREDLSKTYLRIALRRPSAQISPELFDLKREQLLLYRTIKGLRNAIKTVKEKEDGKK